MSDIPSMPDTLQPGLALEAGPADLAELLAVVGSGQPLWDHLTEGKERAALRASSRALRDLADPLITRVSHLVLGQAEDDNGPGSIHPLPAYLMRYWPEGDWPLSADQVQRVKHFLSRLARLEELQLVLGRGGDAQLDQLLQEQGLPPSVTRLELKSDVKSRFPPLTPHLAAGLSTCLPNLHHLQLEAVALIPGVFDSLAACKSLRSLHYSSGVHALDGVDYVDARNTYEGQALAAVSQLSALTQLTQLTQLTRLEFGDANLRHCILHHIVRLTGLKQLSLEPGHGSRVDASDVALLSHLAGLEQLALYLEGVEAQFAPADLMASLRQLPNLRDLSVRNHPLHNMLQPEWLDTLSRLTRLQLDDVPSEGLGEGSLPNLLHLEVQRDDILLPLLKAAPNLRHLYIPSIKISHRTSVEQLLQLTGRLAAAGGIKDREGNPTQLSLWYIDQHLMPELVPALQPLSQLHQPQLRVTGWSKWNEASVRALAAAVPNLHSLSTSDVITALAVGIYNSSLAELTAFHHLRHLELCFPLDPSGLHTLSALHLTSLELTYPKRGLQLRPWPGAAARPTLPTLKVLSLPGNLVSLNRRYHLSDLHHLLHTAPNLEKLIICEWLPVLVPAPDNRYEGIATEVAQLLEETVQKLSVLSLSSHSEPKGRPFLKLDFGNHQYPPPDLAMLMRALASLSRQEGLELHLAGLSSFPAAARQALVQALPQLQVAKLARCQLDMAALVHLVTGLQGLRELCLRQCTRVVPAGITMLCMLAPRLNLRVDSCEGWSHTDAQEAMEAMVSYWKAQIDG